MFFRLYERLFVTVLLLSSMQAFVPLTTEPAAHNNRWMISSELNMSSVAIEGGLYLCAAVLVLRRWRRVLGAARTVWPLVVLISLALFSTAWSVDPIVTLRRGALLLASTLTAIYLGERYSTEEFARLLARTLCLMIVMVIVVFFISPGYVIDHSSQVVAWKGLSAYKNTFGEYMAVTVALLLLVRFRQFRWLRYAFLASATVLLLLSRSATALVCCMLVVAAMPLWRLARRGGAQRALAYTMPALVLLVGIYLMTSNGDLLFQIVGRDSTLTGRTRLWAMALPAIGKHPILGYGYGSAFWAGSKAEALNVWMGSGWVAPLADNGYLDLCLSLGVLGVCTFLYLFVHSVRWALGYFRLEPRRIGLWPITYLCFFALHNVSESTLLTTGSFPFLLFATVTASLAVNRQRAITAARNTESQPMMYEWAPATFADPAAPYAERLRKL